MQKLHKLTEVIFTDLERVQCNLPCLLFLNQLFLVTVLLSAVEMNDHRSSNVVFYCLFGFSLFILFY